jgi:hypothetical protein
MVGAQPRSKNREKLWECAKMWHWLGRLDGGAEGSRTPDLLIANETLYQLSYDPNQNPNTMPRSGGVARN